MQEIEFSKDLDEMNDAELRATLREFRTNYNEAKSDYDELQGQISEYEEDLEAAQEAEETLEELKPTFASMFAEMKDLNEEVVADKFSVDELVDELDEAGAFQLEIDTDDVDDVDDDVEDENKFSEREQKSKNVGDDVPDYQDRIDRFMAGRVVEHDGY